jgi:uncharacterized protein (TIGR03437 family)
MLLSAAGLSVIYATLLGGPGQDRANAVTVDAAGNAYVTGSTDFPLFPNIAPCAFVTKVNATGTRIEWSTCLPASAGTAIGLDGSGSVYVLTGDGLTKLNNSGQLVFSRKLGATGAAMAVDSTGNVYVAGTSGAGLATTSGAYQPALAPGLCKTSTFLQAPPTPCSDAFVMKLDSVGNIVYATYLGGAGQDQANGIAVDPLGAVWITGQTVSANFPVTAGALSRTFHGEIDLGPLQYGDGFVAKLDPTGGKLLYSTFLGGSQPDTGLAIAVDAAGAAYVGGSTQSADFPTTAGVLQRVYSGSANPIPGGPGNGFVTKFDAAGALAWSTYVGASTVTLKVDSQGLVYLIPLAVLSADGSAIVNSAPISGWLAVDPQGAVYVAGAANGYLFFPSASAAQTTFGGAIDATLTKVHFTNGQSAWISTIVNAAGMRTGTPQNYPVYDVAPGEIVSIFGVGFDASTRILFDGIPATILYQGSGQINAVVPFEITGPTTEITVQSAGQTFGPGNMTVLDAVPALFTANGSGKGQAAILNQDGSVNSSANPAAPGTIISIFMTGAGRMNPAQRDGETTPLTGPFPEPVLGVACNLGQVVYAGAAPGLVAGAVQVNVRLGPATGLQLPVVVYTGNYASGLLGDTTVAIR